MPRSLVPPALALALLLAAAPPAAGEICALDDAPGATLLLPWFEVDLFEPDGATTLFSIVNAAPEAHVVRVTVWSDLAVPVLWFDVALTGWDVQTINLRDVLAGTLPSTGGAHSPGGDFSEDGPFPGCDTILPYPPLTAGEVAELRAALTGEPGPISGQCAGRAYGDGVARGYVTVDVVAGCSAAPVDEAYFGPGGQLAFDNVLIGDSFVVDPSRDAAWGEGLVRLEADPEGFAPGDRTFYQTWTGGTASDAREPLPTVWASRFLLGGGFDGGSDLVAWRDLGEPGERFACASPPRAPNMREIVIFDEMEAVVLVDDCVILCVPSGLARLTAATQRVEIGRGDLPTPFPFGLFVLDFKPFDAEAEPLQAWVGLVASAEGRYNVGFDASPLDPPCAPTSDVSPGFP